MNKTDDFYIKTVLLIEDDHALGTLLKYRLELLGISLIHALSGSEAIEYFETHNTPLLMIVDYELNDITGDVLIEKLRTLGVQHPFIAITGAGNEEIASEFLRLGAEDYVIKDLGFINKIESSIVRTLKTITYKYKLQEQQKVIANNEKRYRMIFENIQDVYFVLDNRFHIKEISPSIENVLDIPSEMLINQPVYYILNNRKQWKEGVKKLIEEKVLLNHEITLINRPKNKQAICQVNAKLVEIDGIKCAVISLRDITELRQLQKQLLNIVAETEEKERRQISENIHDNIAPVFATSKMYFTRAFDESKKSRRTEKSLQRSHANAR
ncbi:MAG: response regulator [Bacteroidales bacterium]|nr:response regulator [Bacteroidales bacterium]